jgi:hypothetical protein
MRNISLRYAIGLMLLMSLAGCSVFQPTATPIPPTPIPPTPTSCPYTRNPGPPPPEVEKRAQDAFYAMAAQGIRGRLKVGANGEYSCNQFAIEDIYFEYTLYVPDLEDQAKIREYVSKVTQSAKDSLQGWNMGQVRVHFISGNECWWDELQNGCGPIRPLINE